MKRLILTSTILSVLAVFGAFPVAFATHSTPFNGSFTGSFTLPSQNKAIITGTGHLEHLGKTTLAAVDTATGPASCQGGFTATEKVTFTAANGDKLFTTANEVGCPTSRTTFQLNGPWTITGGTGRFEHASGSGTVHIDGVATSMTGGTFTSTTTGTITY